jgi:hypothetical protein
MVSGAIPRKAALISAGRIRPGMDRLTSRGDVPVGEELRYAPRVRNAVLLLEVGDVVVVTETSNKRAPAGEELAVMADHHEEVTLEGGLTLTGINFVNGTGPFPWLYDDGRDSLGEVLGLHVTDMG